MADFPYDIQPDKPAPAAVVRRRGESQAQTELRGQGYSDEQTGFGSGISSSRSSSGPLNRAAQIALARERMAATQERADDHQSIAERTLSVREQELQAQARIHESSQIDKETAINQTHGFLDDVNKLAEQYGRGTKEFYSGALAVAAKYPTAIHTDPRLGAMLGHYEDMYIKSGGTKDAATALWELGQINPKDPNAAAWLREIPGKYPGAFQQKEVQDFFNSTDKAVSANSFGSNITAPDGTVLKQATINSPGGSMTVTPTPGTNALDPLKVASEVRGNIRSLDQQARTHDKTISEIEKQKPEWLGTTGVFPDANGVRRFGFKDKTEENSPIATAKDEAIWKRYSDATNARKAIGEKLPQLNQQLDDVLAGKVPSVAPAATPAVVASDSAHTAPPEQASLNDSAWSDDSIEPMRPEPKSLDAETAAAIFDEAGRDAGKARQLAKGRGFKF